MATGVLRPLMLLAASGLAREVMAAVAASGTHQVDAVLDDDERWWGRDLNGVRVTGPLSDAADSSADLVICAGSGLGRRAIVGRLADLGIDDARYATIVHPTAVVPRGCRIDVGSVLLAQVVLTADVTVGRHVIVMPHVVLTHDDVVEDFATLAAGVALGGTVRVRSGAYLGMNASVHPGRVVGSGATVGMGAVVTKDVPEAQTWAGVPARPLGVVST